MADMEQSVDAISRAIADTYRRVLKREPDQGGLDYWTSVVVNGYASLDDVLTSMAQSVEAMIVGAYEQYLFRVPTMIERNNWLNAIALSLPVDQAISFIANSGEAQQYRAVGKDWIKAVAPEPLVEAQAQAQLEAQRIQTMPITTLQTEAELEAQALEIESYRSAIIDTGATQADQDFLNQQALIEKQRADLDLTNMQAQAALAMQSGAALEAYAVEVRADVADMYRQILKREADQGGLDYWTNVIVSGDATAELVEISLSQSDEAIILGAYEQYLFRVPAMDERNYWLNAIVDFKLPVAAAINYIANSEEAQQYHAAIVPTPGASPLIVQTINPATGSAQAIDPIMGTSTWGTSYTNQDMIAADPVASPVVELQNYYSPDVNISDLEPVSPIGDTSPALAFKARDEIYKAYTTSLKREPSEADYQYWEPLLVAKDLSLSDFKRYVAESDEAKALVKRANDASLTDGAPPEVVADLTKKSEGVGAAVGLLSALAFFLGQ